MKYLNLLRVEQWIKNLFVFAPVFFSGQLLDERKLLLSSVGFIAFCFVASSIYILNDLIDIDKDRLHPSKKARPIASGQIPKNQAQLICVILIVIGSFIAYRISISFLIVLSVYYLQNILYSLGLKKISIIDILLVSFGFVLRIAAGGVLTTIEVSHWLYIMTFLLSLFIALAKRRDDVLILQNTGAEMRTSIKEYNLDFISSALSVLSAVLIVSYLHYVTSTEVLERFHGKYAYVSIVFVIAGMLRYLQITMVEIKSGSPTKLIYNDRFLQVILLLWISFFTIIIYLV